MSFAFPTLADCVTRARQRLTGALPGLDAWLWPNNIGPTAKALGEGENEIWGRVAVLEKRRFVWSADWVGLLEHGRDYGMAPLPGTAGSGMVNVVSTDALAVADGAVLSRADGLAYVVSGAASLAAAGSLSLSVVPTSVGRAANCLAGQALTAASGVTGAGASSATFTVAAGGIVGGTDAEGREAFRSRLLFRKRYPPAAGAPADYVRWATAVPGCTGAFVERCWPAPGGVRVFPIGDGSSGNAQPSVAVVAAVAQAIALQQPADAAVTVAQAPTQAIDITISGLLPMTTAVEEAIRAELRDLFARRSRVAGNDTAVAGLPFLATPVSFSRSWIGQAISAATGEDRHVLTAPAADVAIAAGALPVLGNVTFV